GDGRMLELVRGRRRAGDDALAVVHVQLRTAHATAPLERLLDRERIRSRRRRRARLAGERRRAGEGVAMALLPEAAALLDRIAARDAPPLSAMSGARARHASMAFLDLQGAPEDVETVRDLLIPGPAGRLPARVYSPSGEARRPL